VLLRVGSCQRWRVRAARAAARNGHCDQGPPVLRCAALSPCCVSVTEPALNCMAVMAPPARASSEPCGWAMRHLPSYAFLGCCICCAGSRYWSSGRFVYPNVLPNNTFASVLDSTLHATGKKVHSNECFLVIDGCQGWPMCWAAMLECQPGKPVMQRCTIVTWRAIACEVSMLCLPLEAPQLHCWWRPATRMAVRAYLAATVAVRQCG
jgi:hypothetical protein